MTRAMLLGVALLFASSGACAQDAAKFSGPYVGAALTADSVTVGGEDIFENGDEFRGLGDSGVGGSIFAGYNFLFGTAGVAGLEINGDISTAKLVFDDTVDRVQIKAKEGFGVTARVGAAINNQTLLYARGGYQRTRVRFSDPDDVAFGSFSEWGDGVRAGVGLESSFGGGNTKFRVEYNYNNYEAGVLNHQALAGIVLGF